MARVLVVDDDKDVCTIIQLLLEADGYETDLAYSGPQALSALDQRTPDLILLDVMMPGMDGFEVLRRVREREEGLTLPVILLTAKAEIEDKTTGFTSGADDYVVKPFDNTELKLRVAAHIRRYWISSERERYHPTSVIRVPIVLQRVRSGVFRRGYQITKRLFDLFVSLMALPFALPLMLAVAIAIRLDSPGNVLFVQNRTGMNGRRFRMLKFRTMLIDAEELKLKYAHLNELTWPDFKITDDPRVTRVGKFLRRTSLDEIPQLFNIIKGDMSLVGPRPTSFAADTYDLWQTERLEVRPGLTGLWQVKGRADVDFDERVELDIEYIERQGWRLDLTILYLTFSAVITGRGAH
jgi:lipopolysaccharide/colanic/teichoic acid biosynthesis glycosyltransferase